MIMFIAGAGLIAMSLGACRRHCGHGFGQLKEKHLNYISKKLASKLDLDDAQKAKLETIKGELVAKLGSFKSMRKDVQQEFVNQLNADKFDDQKVNKLFETKEKEWAETRKFLTAKMSEFHAMLKPEQRKKLAALIEDRIKSCDKE
jgi:periplasmic protein CpxP/Spy